MSKKVIKWILSTIIILGAIWILIFSIDYMNYKNHRQPIFTIGTTIYDYENGYAHEYNGIGYKAIKYQIGENPIQWNFVAFRNITTSEIVHQNIEKETKEHTYSKNAKLLIAIIDNIMKEDAALNHEMKYIAIDFESFLKPRFEEKANIQDKENYQKDYMLTQQDITDILEYTKKYHENVMYASMKDLKEKGLFHEKEIYIDGILIYAGGIQKCKENEITMEVCKYKSGLGAIFPTYEAKYKKDTWELKITQMAIS